jgi:hypothetical protein
MASDAPTIKTPEGAINPNPTGIKHGPFGMHSPTFPIIQLDAGTVAAKAEIIRNLNIEHLHLCRTLRPFYWALNSVYPSRHSFGAYFRPFVFEVSCNINAICAGKWPAVPA